MSASAVEEQTGTTDEMSRSVAEAATGSSEVAANMVCVAQAAAATTHGVGESQRAATRSPPSPSSSASSSAASAPDQDRDLGVSVTRPAVSTWADGSVGRPGADRLLVGADLRRSRSGQGSPRPSEAARGRCRSGRVAGSGPALVCGALQWLLVLPMYLTAPAGSARPGGARMREVAEAVLDGTGAAVLLLRSAAPWCT